MVAFTNNSGSKELSFKNLDGPKAGGSSGASGRTGSSRSYPKGGSKPGDTQDAPFNPFKVPASTIYVGGVD